MDDPLLAGRRQAVEELEGQRHRLLEWDRTGFEALGEILSLHELHDQEALTGATFTIARLSIRG